MDMHLLSEGRGVYILVLELNEKKRLKIGRLGDFDFPKGFYFYVGSAKGGFKKRISRYLKPIKKKRWHIDYIIPHMKLIAILTIEGYYDEDRLSEILRKKLKPFVRGFGASDSRASTHLFYAEVIDSQGFHV